MSVQKENLEKRIEFVEEELFMAKVIDNNLTIFEVKEIDYWKKEIEKLEKELKNLKEKMKGQKVIEMKNFVKKVMVYDFESIFDGFCVEVSETKDEKIEEEMIEFHLYHKDYGIKNYMFGLLKKDIKDEWQIRDIIANNIEEYISAYVEEIIN